MRTTARRGRSGGGAAGGGGAVLLAVALALGRLAGGCAGDDGGPLAGAWQGPLVVNEPDGATRPLGGSAAEVVLGDGFIDTGAAACGVVRGAWDGPPVRDGLGQLRATFVPAAGAADCPAGAGDPTRPAALLAIEARLDADGAALHLVAHATCGGDGCVLAFDGARVARASAP